MPPTRTPLSRTRGAYRQGARPARSPVYWCPRQLRRPIPADHRRPAPVPMRARWRCRERFPGSGAGRAGFGSSYRPVSGPPPTVFGRLCRSLTDTASLRSNTRRDPEREQILDVLDRLRVDPALYTVVQFRHLKRYSGADHPRRNWACPLPPASRPLLSRPQARFPRRTHKPCRRWPLPPKTAPRRADLVYALLTR